MNKITATLAGLAIVAGASIAPAFAQGAFSGPVTFTFGPTPAPGTFNVLNQLVTYNAAGSSVFTTGYLSLTGGQELGIGSPVYSSTKLSFSNNSDGSAPLFTDTVGLTTVVNTGGTNYSIASVGATTNKNQFSLVGSAPVPEASTVISFGALLALGGLAVLRRKSSVQNAA